MKLSIKIFLMTGLITLAGVLGVSFFSYHITRSSLEEKIGAERVNLAQNLVANIDQYLFRRYLEIQLIATSKPFKNLFFGGTKEEMLEVENRVDDFKKFTGPWDILHIVDASGKILFSSKDVKDKNIRDYPGSFEAFSESIKGTTYFSDVVISEECGKATIIFSAPIRNMEDPKQPILGAVVGHLNWSFVLEILKDQEGLSLYNKDGLFIGSSKGSEGDILKADYRERFKAYNLRSGKGSFIFADSDGNNFFISYAHEVGHDDYAGRNWILIAEVPTGIIFAPAGTAALRSTLFLSPILLILGALILLIFSKFVLKPLKYLTNVSQSISAGDIKKRAEIKSRDEIEILASSFNKMAETLTKERSELELRVKQRTNELDKKISELEENKAAMLNLLEDVEEEKLKLARESAEDEALLGSLGEGVIATDRKGRIIYINKVAESLFGYSSAKVKGKFFNNIFPLEDEAGKKLDIKKRPLYLALQSNKPSVSSNYYYTRGKNNRFAAWASASPIVLNKKTIGAIGVFRDITREKEVDKAKTEFVSLASHQLRTPLTGIKWYVEMLLSGEAGKLNQVQKNYLNEVYNNEERMSSLVNALLNVSRIEMGTLAIDSEPTDIVQLLRETVHSFAVDIKKKNLKFSQEIEKAIPLIAVDPKLTSIIFQNLISNAIKYTPSKGSVKVKMSWDKENIIFTVSDTGYGIPAGQQDKIFTKLFRADNIRTKVTNGTGLGLYTAKAVVDGFGGKIWFKSKEGKGTTFFSSIPLAGVKKKKGIKGLLPV
ncbi:MAG: ATP-binding protein [Patescibacteria group bacterium]